MQTEYGQEMTFGDSAEEAASEMAEALDLGIILKMRGGREFKAGETRIWTWKISSTRYAARAMLG